MTPEEIEENPDQDVNTLPVYTYNLNYNYEQDWEYGVKVQDALDQRQVLEKVKNEPFQTRQSRVVWDKPRLDTDISAYDCWQEYGDMMMSKEYPHELRVVFKLEVSPKVMVHCFGESLISDRNDVYSTKEWDFVDSNFDQFLVYDFKSSTSFWGENKSEEWYANNINRKPRFRRDPQLSPEEFWTSEEPHAFRVNCSRYAQWPKFRAWLLKEIETRKEGPSYEQLVEQECGEMDIMDNYNKEYTHRTTNVLLNNQRKDFIKSKKWKPKTDIDRGFVAAEKPDDKFKIDITGLY